MTPDIFMEQARRIESKMLAQSLLRSTLMAMHEGAAAAKNGEAENAYRLKLHSSLDEALDTSNELVKLKETFVNSNR